MTPGQVAFSLLPRPMPFGPLCRQRPLWVQQLLQSWGQDVAAICGCDLGGGVLGAGSLGRREFEEPPSASNNIPRRGCLIPARESLCYILVPSRDPPIFPSWAGVSC